MLGPSLLFYNKSALQRQRQNHRSENPIAATTERTKIKHTTSGQQQHITINENENESENNVQGEDNSKVKEDLLSLCFITCEFSISSDVADVLPIVDPSMRQTNPPRHFVFTNLIGPQEQNKEHVDKNSNNNNNYRYFSEMGWKAIYMPELEQNYTRLITRSRWPKFMAWQHPTIQKQCDVIYYGDAYLLNPINETFWQQLGRQIIKATENSTKENDISTGKEQPAADHTNMKTIGLMQNRQPYIRTILHEIYKNTRLGKDSPERAQITKDFFHSHGWFRKNKRQFKVYKNALFGYNPRDVQYQQLTTDFWSEYSKERGSWRDQPYWAFYLVQLGRFKLQRPSSLFWVLANH